MKTLKAAAIVGLILIAALYIQDVTTRARLAKKAAAIKSILSDEKLQEMEIAPPAAIPVVEVKVAKESLPEDEFVTTRRIKETTPDGVKAIAEGTRVKRVGERNGNLLISDSKITLEALASEITNDKELADSLLAKALANKPVPVAPALPDMLPQPKEEVKIKKDYSNQILAISEQIRSIEEQIKDLRINRKGAISANGAVIARLEIELNKLKSQKNYLTQAQN